MSVNAAQLEFASAVVQADLERAGADLDRVIAGIGTPDAVDGPLGALRTQALALRATLGNTVVAARGLAAGFHTYLPPVPPVPIPTPGLADVVINSIGGKLSTGAAVAVVDGRLEVTAGDRVVLDAEVGNIGTADVAADKTIGVAYMADGETDAAIVSWSDTVKGLAKGAKVRTPANLGPDGDQFWTAPTLPAATPFVDHTITGYVDNPYPAVGAQGRIPELNELNNKRTVVVRVKAAPVAPGPIPDPPPPSSGNANVALLTGTFPTDGPTANTRLDALAGRLHHPIYHVCLNLGQDSWTAANVSSFRGRVDGIVTGGGQGSQNLLARTPALTFWVTVPLAMRGFGSASDQHKAVARGDHDADLKYMMDRFNSVAGGGSRLMARLDSEPDIPGGYPYEGLTDPPAFHDAIRRASGIIHAGGGKVVGCSDGWMNLTSDGVAHPYGAGTTNGEKLWEPVIDALDGLGNDPYYNRSSNLQTSLNVVAQQVAFVKAWATARNKFACFPEWGFVASVLGAQNGAACINHFRDLMAGFPAEGPAALRTHCYFDGWGPATLADGALTAFDAAFDV